VLLPDSRAQQGIVEVYLPEITIHEVESLNQAAECLHKYGAEAKVLAGGTDLFVDLKTARIRAGRLISLQRLTFLRGIEEAADGLAIGALTTISQVNRSSLVRQRFRPLIDATSKMAAPQVRNAATVGGNIASAVPCADLPPIMTAMNASVCVWSDGRERSEPLESFIINVRETKLKVGEILTSVRVPRQPDGFGAAYARFALRDGNAIAVASVAASLLVDEHDVIRAARVVLGAVAPMPVLVTSAETALVGCAPSDELWALAAHEAENAARPICDVRGSADFRRRIVAVMTRRALAAALVRAREREA
jgi:carbon-monoxide dehydrogenase medium subunit